jgi:hypothetical protein
MPNLVLNSVANLKNGGNMVDTKWKSYAEVDPKREYCAVIGGMGERKSVLSFFSFLTRSRAVQKQANAAKGLIGNMGRVEFLGKKVINFALFEDEKAENEFVHTGAHANCMDTTKSAMKGEGKYARWQISGSDLPPKLEDGIKRIQSEEAKQKPS